MPTPPTKIILASESPRRRELLAALGLTFAVRPADIDETQWPDEPPDELAVRLSHVKALVASGAAPGALVIAADTLVVLDDHVLDKPATPDDALQILCRLRGRTHRVLTGLTLRYGATGDESTQLAVTPVAMRDYGEDEMRAYVASGDPMDKAGAYAIQNEQFAPVARLQNCYANVVGLPLCHLYRAMADRGIAMHHPLAVCPWPVQHGHCDWAAPILQNESEQSL